MRWQRGVAALAVFAWASLFSCTHDYEGLNGGGQDGGAAGQSGLAGASGFAGGGRAGAAEGGDGGGGASGGAAPSDRLECGGVTVDPTSDASHCGDCDNDCTLLGAGLSCIAGTCRCSEPGQCRTGGPGSVDCDTQQSVCSCDGTLCVYGEVCARVGSLQTCTCNGTEACSAAQVCCQEPAGCRDLKSDAGSCGACGRACPPSFECRDGICLCLTHADCQAGASGSCESGACRCGATSCPPGQRCTADGVCG